MRRVTLEQLAHDEDAAETDAAELVLEMPLTQPPAPEAFRNLSRFEQLGLLTGDTILSLIAQAPVDPLGLYAALRETAPDGWVFSALDFSVVRILARDEHGVRASIRIDLLSDDVMLMRRRDGQLALYWGLVGDELAQWKYAALPMLQTRIDEAVATAQ